MKRIPYIAFALALGMLALNLVAFASLERRSKALDNLQTKLTRAFDVARDTNLIQRSEPPRGLLIFAIYYDDYGDGIDDLCGAVGTWNGQSLIHSYRVRDKTVSYAVANKAPNAWYPLPSNL